RRADRGLAERPCGEFPARDWGRKFLGCSASCCGRSSAQEWPDRLEIRLFLHQFGPSFFLEHPPTLYGSMITSPRRPYLPSTCANAIGVSYLNSYAFANIIFFYIDPWL